MGVQIHRAPERRAQGAQEPAERKVRRQAGSAAFPGRANRRERGEARRDAGNVQRLRNGRAVLAARVANQFAVLADGDADVALGAVQRSADARRDASGGASRASGTSAAARCRACARCRSGRCSSGSRPRPPWARQRHPVALDGPADLDRSMKARYARVRRKSRSAATSSVISRWIGDVAIGFSAPLQSAASRKELPIQREPALVAHEIADARVSAGPGRPRSAAAIRNTSGHVPAEDRRSPGSSSSRRTALSKERGNTRRGAEQWNSGEP